MYGVEEADTPRINCRTLNKTQKLAAAFPNTRAIVLDVADTDLLLYHVAEHDAVISLLPYIHHPAVIEAAIAGRTHVITTSYVSEDMRELNGPAKRAGITVLNEVGVDLGVDYIYAIKKIDEVYVKGGKILEFYSYCGGLPAPECAGNPLGFGFSWSPWDALLSQRNSARYLKDGDIVHIPAEELMAKAAPYYVKDGYDFVAYANRDSVPFREFYNIPEAKTVIRGSLRYQGNPAFVMALAKLGWLEQDGKEWLRDGMGWAEIQRKVVGAVATDEESLVSNIKEIFKFSDIQESERIISGLKQMGILSMEKAVIVFSLARVRIRAPFF